MTVHIPVLPQEVLEGMNLKPGDIAVDGTLGGGGHSRRILEAVGENGKLIAVDRDPGAVEETASRLAAENLFLSAANYADLPEILEGMQLPAVQAILLDLGLSSDQLAARERGFSFHSDGELDLRFDCMSGEPAFRLVNRLPFSILPVRQCVNIDYQIQPRRRRVFRRKCPIALKFSAISAERSGELVLDKRAECQRSF